MSDENIQFLLERCAIALERMADHFAPQDKPLRSILPATLGKAIYSREEREKSDFKKEIQKTSQQARIVPG